MVFTNVYLQYFILCGSKIQLKIQNHIMIFIFSNSIYTYSEIFYSYYLLVSLYIPGDILVSEFNYM